MNSFNGKVNAEYLNQVAIVFSPIKQQSYKKMQIGTGDSVMDLGCGPGIDALELGKIVSPKGKVFGVDHDLEMLEHAERQAKTFDLEDVICYQQANADLLPFEENYFDSSRCERLFMHLSNPEKVLAEIHRVTKPGRKAVVIETDWASLSIDCKATHTEHLLSTYRNEKVLTNGYSGRSLYRLFQNEKFSNVEIEVIPLFTNNLELFYALSLQEVVENNALNDGVISPDELQQWQQELSHKAAAETFYCSVNMVIVSGDA